MSKDTTSDKVSNPRNSLGILRSLDFQRDTEYLREVSSVGETTRLAHCQAACQLLPCFKGDDLLVELVDNLLVAKNGTICAFDTQAEKSTLEDSNVSEGQMISPIGMLTYGRSSEGRLMVSNKAVMPTNLDFTVSFPQPWEDQAHVDTSEMGLIR